MANISRFKTNKDKELKGVLVDTGLDGLKVRVARIGNPEYKAYVKRNSSVLQAQARLGVVDIQALEKINKDASSKYILLDWENLTEDDGTPIPYSSERARALFDEAPDFYEMVSNFANDMKLFQDQFQENSKGN